MKHGGDLGEARGRYGVDLPWLDLSTGINPHAWPIPDALRQADWSALPSRADLDRLLAAARDAYAVPAGLGIVAAPGTQALIQWLPRLAPPGAAVIVGPTYAEHADAWRAAGRRVVPIADAADMPADMPNLVVVSPNNPDGRILAVEELGRAAERCAGRGGWVVVDESFADVAPDASAIGRMGDLPVVVLRSFGKFFGLAGLRLGFAVAPAGIAAAIETALGPWAVSAPALAIGALALADHGWAAAMRLRLARESVALDRVLGDAGLAVVGGTSLYRLARCRDAAGLHDGLARRGIWVRRFDWSTDLLRFGLPPDASASERLASALGVSA